MTDGLLEANIAEIEARGGQLQVEDGQILYSVPRDVAHLVDMLRPRRHDVAQLLCERQKEAALEADAPGVPASPRCPPLPEGVRLLRYTPRKPPLAVAPIAAVTDIDEFIRMRLDELRAALQCPVATLAGRVRFHIMAQLAEAGVDLVLDETWPWQ